MTPILVTDTLRCLDKGHVKLLDSMGDDKAIVDAARTSISGKEVKAVQNDRALIRYLMRNRHTTPFEMVEFKFEMKMPIFVARQWIRHRTANVNEMSGRYSVLPEEYYIPEASTIQGQATKNKQGRDDVQLDNADDLQGALEGASLEAFIDYRQFLSYGMARELARIVLPLNTYTQWVWKCDLHNILNLLSLRMHEHAQYEIRVYADAMASLIKPFIPHTWEAFEDYRLNGMFLTAQDVSALSTILNDGLDDGPIWYEDEVADQFKTRREWNEFKDKLKRLKLPGLPE